MNRILMTALLGGAFLVPATAAGPTGSTIHAFQSYADNEDFISGYYEVTPDGMVKKIWDYPYASSGAVIKSGWTRDGRLCGLAVLTLGSEDLVGAYAYQEYDASTGKTLVSRTIDVENERLPYFYTAAYCPEDGRIYGFGRKGIAAYDSDYAFVFKSAPADTPEEAEAVKVIEPYERCLSFCWHPVDKCFYGVNTRGEVVRYNRDGSSEVLFATGMDNIAFHTAGLTYSPYDGYLLWCPSVIDNVADMYAIWPEQKRFEKLHRHSRDRQFTFFVCDDFNVEATAPAAPVFKGASFTEGSLSGTLSYTMPSATYGGTAASGAMDWTLYLNGTRATSGTAAAGSELPVAVEVPENGVHTFRLEASLGGKAGVPCATRMYVGYDSPAAPADVTLDNTSVSWKPVTSGTHGGYLDAKAIKYDVYLNDSLISSTTDTSVTFSLDPEKEVTAYRASVVAEADGMRSEKGVSQKKVMGKPLTLPVTIVPTAAQAELMTIVNRDGSPEYGVWSYTDSWEDPCFSSGWSYEQPDDWLILPAIDFPSHMVQYNFTIDAARGGSIGTREYFEILAGTSPDPESMTIPVMTKTRAKKYNQWNEHSSDFAVPAAGTYYIAVHGISDPDQKALLVKNFRISATDKAVEAPAAVTGLEVTDSSNSELKATVAFSMPLKFIDGSDIPVDTEITAVVKGASECELKGLPGSAQTATVSTVQGDNYITVTTMIGQVAGQSAETTVWTGMDMLGYVEDYTSELSEDNMSITLRWKAPKESLNGGYFTTTGIRYWIAELASDASIAGDTIFAGTDVFEYNLNLPAGTPQRLMRIAVIAENAAGLSNARWFISQIAGEPYSLPMNENFNNMELTYGPMVSQRPSAAYENGGWTWGIPGNVDPMFAERDGYAMVGYTDAEQASVRIRMPKFRTSSAGSVKAAIEIWNGKKAADHVSVLAITHGMDKPETIATVPAGEGWTTVNVNLPEKFLNRPWTNLYLDGHLASAENYLLLSGYSIYDTTGVSGISDAGGSIRAENGSLLISGFEGEAFVVSTADGRIVATGTAAAETAVSLEPGIYIVRAGASGARILVR